MRRAKRDHARHDASTDEPRPGDDGWEEYGGELMWVVGHTEGGAPYGLKADEFRLANEQFAGAAGWACARFVLKQVLDLPSDPGTHANVDWVRMIGRGMSREIFGADVQLTPDPSHRSGP